MGPATKLWAISMSSIECAALSGSCPSCLLLALIMGLLTLGMMLVIKLCGRSKKRPK